MFRRKYFPEKLLACAAAAGNIPIYILWIIMRENLTIKKIVERAKNLHPWTMTPREAVGVQKRLASRVSMVDSPAMEDPALIVTFDISSKLFGKTLYAVAVAWDVKRGEIVSVSRSKFPVTFPYVPGLLSFRETPPMIEALGGLEEVPDLFLCDGHGIMHPRLFGLACHMGVAAGIPSIGCAKSRLTGDHVEVGREKGERAVVKLGEKKVGYIVRTRRNVKPLYVSPGHMVSCERAVEVVMSLIGKTRIPDPLKVAHSQSVAFMRRHEYGR